MELDKQQTTIDVYLRIRPSLNRSTCLERDELSDDKIHFKVPVDVSTVNNTKSHYGFEFNGILDEKASQKDVFQTVGIPVTKNVLDGYNSTIFAYGQTGSGKTYTITGGPERYEDRGIIPRVISNLFRTMQDASRSGTTYSCYVSYLEIYNSSGYDLLVKDNTTKLAATDERMPPKVTMLEDEYGAFHFKGLSLHMVSSEEEALDLLFVGDTNRAIAATEMNQNSTRSHCIFTIMLEKRQVGCDTVTRSKLNIVDLAGSERVSRTNSAGQILQEAKYINSSLFFLEMVIVALHEKEKQGKDVHIPYRNSMMTSVLRDSLGGNCKTIMVATISPESQHTDESISTCNFAQRVKCVKNTASVNEEIEPELVIQRLKAEVRRLKEEVEFLSGSKNEDDEGCSSELDEEDIDELTKSIESYIQDREEHAHLDFCGSITIPKIHTVCSIFKDMIIAERSASSSHKANSASLPGNNTPQPAPTHSAPNIVGVQAQADTTNVRDNDTANLTRRSRGNKDVRSSERETIEVCGVPLCKDSLILDEPANAFAWFKERYPGSAAIESSKSALKSKYLEAKSTGARIEDHKRKIDYHKGMINKETDPSRVKLNSDAMMNEKKAYMDSLSKLRELKKTIESNQKVIEAGRLKMQSDFDRWHDSCTSAPEHYDEPIKGDDTSQGDDANIEFKLPPGIKLTGNKEADDDIIAFFRAKELLLSKASSTRRV